MKRAIGICIVIVGFAFVSGVEAQTSARDAKAIAKVKNFDVSHFDRGLPRQKDFPICVQASGNIDRVEVSVQIVVGTHKRGLLGPPAIWGIWITINGKESKSLDKLNELAAEVTNRKPSVS